MTQAVGMVMGVNFVTGKTVRSARTAWMLLVLKPGPT